MTRDEVFAAWAPAGSHWSEWAKPVLFAQMPLQWTNEKAAPPTLPATVDAVAIKSAAIIVDLPADAGVGYAAALARHGWRPVPLYNGAAHGRYSSLDAAGTFDTSATIDVWGIMRALWGLAEEIRGLAIPADGPPVFMLDSRRRIGERSPLPGIFDNRWLSFPTDFPSASYLQDHGIYKVILVTNQNDVPNDLLHTLLRWQEAGVEIHLFQVDVDAVPRLISVGRPSRFRAAWYLFAATLGLRRRLLGGFGGAVPHPSSG